MPRVGPGKEARRERGWPIYLQLVCMDHEAAHSDLASGCICCWCCSRSHHEGQLKEHVHLMWSAVPFLDIKRWSYFQKADTRSAVRAQQRSGFFSDPLAGRCAGILSRAAPESTDRP